MSVSPAPHAVEVEEDEEVEEEEELDEDGLLPHERTPEFQAALARGLADAKAGRTVPAEVVMAKLRAMRLQRT